jgi:hypothetical protein
MKTTPTKLILSALLALCVSNTSQGQSFGDKAKLAVEVPLMVIGGIASIPSEMLWNARAKREAKVVGFDWRFNSLAGKFECRAINKYNDTATNVEVQPDAMCAGPNPLAHAVALSLDSFMHCFAADARTGQAVELSFDSDPALCNWTDDQIKFNSVLPAAQAGNPNVRYTLWYFDKKGPAPLACRSNTNGQWGENVEDISLCRIEDPKPLSQFRLPGTF